MEDAEYQIENEKEKWESIEKDTRMVVPGLKMRIQTFKLQSTVVLREGKGAKGGRSTATRLHPTSPDKTQPTNIIS